jgi:hypothetical protein
LTAITPQRKGAKDAKIAKENGIKEEGGNGRTSGGFTGCFPIRASITKVLAIPPSFLFTFASFAPLRRDFALDIRRKK